MTRIILIGRRVNKMNENGHATILQKGCSICIVCPQFDRLGRQLPRQRVYKLKLKLRFGAMTLSHA
jgi:hypothetical protein